MSGKEFTDLVKELSFNRSQTPARDWETPKPAVISGSTRVRPNVTCDLYRGKRPLWSGKIVRGLAPFSEIEKHKAGWGQLGSDGARVLAILPGPP